MRAWQAAGLALAFLASGLACLAASMLVLSGVLGQMWKDPRSQQAHVALEEFVRQRHGHRVTEFPEGEAEHVAVDGVVGVVAERRREAALSKASEQRLDISQPGPHDRAD